MIYTASPLAVIIFFTVVAAVLGISFYYGRKTKSAKGYFAAGGTIHWSVNGIAFAGDYLSAASFLGICGMIAFSGFDGFLYSIGYLAGWIVALFVVAEPLKRMGKFTFADALDARFGSQGIRLAAAISTLVVSIFYLIPQMVGAGALVTPLLGLPHWVGVTMVGSIVIFIVTTAGMTSTTYVQFLKGAMLLVFSLILVFLVLGKGVQQDPYEDYHDFVTLQARVTDGSVTSVEDPGYRILAEYTERGHHYVKLEKDGIADWWNFEPESGTLTEALSIVTQSDGAILYNGAPRSEQLFYPVGNMADIRVGGDRVDGVSGLNAVSFLAIIQESDVVLWVPDAFSMDGERVRIWTQQVTPGNEILSPGLKFHLDEGATFSDRLNFISLMLALFFGTAALPHVLIRYYTVPTPSAARKSTIVAIAAIGFFYILTLYMGLGAMINGVIDVESSNMSAPLLAQSFGPLMFAVISAIAFATVLGTVSGLIVASSGAVAHDFIDTFLKRKLSDHKKVIAGKFAAVGTGIVAILLGIAFRGMNVAYLVGLAFAIAASANLPSIVMVLFWKKVTSRGIAASIATGIVSSVGIILLSPSMYSRYGMDPSSAPLPLDNPGIVSIPLSFLVLVIVSLMTQSRKAPEPGAETVD
ncbi:MAG: cation acetate symporter [Candidatus Fermentibacteraceae bacterium]|nr:cation acetate symporter [Candidatus Fermentibacteraceae bacterium]MBN2607711.1 cation acetate symporter [Candidatus Fermentibacteraceae bacterium]